MDLTIDSRIFMGMGFALFIFFLSTFYTNYVTDHPYLIVWNSLLLTYICVVYSIGTVSKANRFTCRYDWWRVFMGYDFVIPVMTYDSVNNVSTNLVLRERIIWAVQNLKPNEYQFRGFTFYYTEPIRESNKSLLDSFDSIEFSMLRQQDALIYKLTCGSN